MKIGILTFHNAHNYGAVLQAYALRLKLQNMGGDEVSIINYRNSEIDASYEDILRIPEKVCWIKHPRIAKKVRRERKQIEFAQPAWKRQCEAFKIFINEYLLENKCEVYSAKDLEKLELDVFICGSDQIWTSWLTGG